MSQTEKLTDQEVHYIIGAFDVASGEHDGDYSELKAKLFRMNPKVKVEIDDYDKRVQRASDNQAKSRKHVTKVIYDGLYLNIPILPQLKTWIAFESNYDLLRKHSSDEICLAGDLWKYHLRGLSKAGLLQELRDHLQAEGQKKGNEWMKDNWETTSDKDLWHELIRHLERARR